MSPSANASAENFELFFDPQHRLVLRRPDQADIIDVRIRRAFPWSKADRFISIRNAEGKEIFLIDDLTQVEPAARLILQQILSDSSFIPKIVKVQSVDIRFGYQQWKVRTDRGPAEFRVQEREDIRFLPDGRLAIRDADGNVYELPNLHGLDESSRRAIEALV